MRGQGQRIDPERQASSVLEDNERVLLRERNVPVSLAAGQARNLRARRSHHYRFLLHGDVRKNAGLFQRPIGKEVFGY